MLTSLVTLLTLGHPVSLALPPAVLKYRVEITSEVILGEKDDPDYLHDLTEATAFISLTMTDTTIGRFASFVLDSMTFNGGETAMDAAMQEPALLKNPKGATVRFLVVAGEMNTRLVPPVVSMTDDNLPLGTVLPALPALFPAIRKDAKVGATWSDTMKAGEVGVPDIITAWTVTAGEGDALTFTGTRNTTRRNSAPDSSVMNGKEVARHQLTTNAAGPARRILIESTMEGVITGGEAPASGVPIKTVRTLKILPLP